jgi:hypothetical protein
VVTVDDSQVTNVTFVATDSIRYVELDMDLSAFETLDALEQALADTVADAMTQAASDGVGRALVVRAVLTGRSDLARAFNDPETSENLCTRICETFADARPFVWFAGIKCRAAPPVDLAERQQARDLAGQILSIAHEYLEGAADPADLLDTALSPLFSNRRAKKVLETPSDEDLRQMLDEARLLCLDLLERFEP